jgi:uncharacterized phosphosugar-binding protein
MRIGEVLGLRHEDIHSRGVNEIQVTNRLDNVNDARAKTGDRIIHVSKEIIGITACGRATIVALRLNNNLAVIVRKNWVQAGWHPPD